MVNFTTGIDAEFLIVIKMTLDDSIVRMSNKVDVTLSGNLYSADILKKDSINLSDESLTNAINGSTMPMSYCSFSIARKNSGLGDFPNSIYPASGDIYLINRIVDLGFCYFDTTSESNVMWFKQYYISQVTRDKDYCNIRCYEIDEFYGKYVPTLVIQKDIDDGLSYFPNAPAENVGKPLPLVYGDFYDDPFERFDYPGWETQVNMTGYYKYVPALQVDTTIDKFIIASHKMFSTPIDGETYATSILYKYLSPFNTYMRVNKSWLDPNDATTINNVLGYSVTLRGNANTGIYGSTYLKLTTNGTDTANINLAALNDNDYDNYIEVGGQQTLQLTLGGSDSSDSFGIPNSASPGDVQIYFILSAANDTRNVTIGYYNTQEMVYGLSNTFDVTTTIGVGSIGFGENATGKSSGLPWTIESLSALDFYVANNDVQSTNMIRLYGCFLAVYAKLYYVTTKIKQGSKRARLYAARITEGDKYLNSNKGIYSRLRL